MKEQFDRDGYVVLDKVFSHDEVTALKADIQRILGPSAGGEKLTADGDALEGFRKHGVFVGLAVNSPLFREAAGNERIVGALREIVGEHVIFLSDKLVRKDAATDFASPWHQDWPYWEGSHKFSVWIALDAATRENGCLKVVPGSHRRGEMAHGGAANDGLGFSNRLDAETLDENEAVPVAVGAGAAVIFHDLLFHASYPNTSGRDRWALISTYKNGDEPDPAYSWAAAAFTVSPAS
jgi:ectoine hydroxylase-related dioxygenase (phytanoyl-CoA dioxygenase family)